MQTILHTKTPTAGDTWRPTLSAGVWMNDRGTLWLSRRRSTGTWTVTDIEGNELAEHRPDTFTIVD